MQVQEAGVQPDAQKPKDKKNRPSHMDTTGALGFLHQAEAAEGSSKSSLNRWRKVFTVYPKSQTRCYTGVTCKQIQVGCHRS